MLFHSIDFRSIVEPVAWANTMAVKHAIFSVEYGAGPAVLSGSAHDPLFRWIVTIRIDDLGVFASESPDDIGRTKKSAKANAVGSLRRRIVMAMQETQRTNTAWLSTCKEKQSRCTITTQATPVPPMQDIPKENETVVPTQLPTPPYDSGYDTGSESSSASRTLSMTSWPSTTPPPPTNLTKKQHAQWDNHVTHVQKLNEIMSGPLGRQQNTVLIGIDFETQLGGSHPEALLEMGLAVLPYEKLGLADSSATVHHYSVEEREGDKNTRRIFPLEPCAFASTTRVPMSDLAAALRQVLAEVAELKARAVLVAWDDGLETRVLQTLGFEKGDITLVDASAVDMVKRQTLTRRSLGAVAVEYGVAAATAHNAGNDAMQTVLILGRMMLRQALFGEW